MKSVLGSYNGDLSGLQDDTCFASLLDIKSFVQYLGYPIRDFKFWRLLFCIDN